MYTTTPPTQLLCSCVRCDQGRRASQLCRCGQSVGRWCSKGKQGSVFSFFRRIYSRSNPKRVWVLVVVTGATLYSLSRESSLAILSHVLLLLVSMQYLLYGAKRGKSPGEGENDI